MKNEFRASNFTKGGKIKNKRIYFDFQNYNYTAPAQNGTNGNQFIVFRNVSVTNLDFSSNGNFSEGSFIRTDHSNIKIDGVRVANLSSYGRGAFMNMISPNVPVPKMINQTVVPYNETLV